MLGTFPFAAGEDGFVRLVVDDPAYHRVNAVRFRPIDPATLLPRITELSASPVPEPGGTTTVTATLTAPALVGATGCASLGLPPGWSATPATKPVNRAPGASQAVTFTVTTPADAAVNALYEIALQPGGASRRVAVPVGTPDPARQMIGIWELDPATAAASLSAQQARHHRADAVRFEPVVAAGAAPGC